jgi:hypothetical protein
MTEDGQGALAAYSETVNRLVALEFQTKEEALQRLMWIREEIAKGG